MNNHTDFVEKIDGELWGDLKSRLFLHIYKLQHEFGFSDEMIAGLTELDENNIMDLKYKSVSDIGPEEKKALLKIHMATCSLKTMKKFLDCREGQAWHNQPNRLPVFGGSTPSTFFSNSSFQEVVNAFKLVQAISGRDKASACTP